MQPVNQSMDRLPEQLMTKISHEVDLYYGRPHRNATFHLLCGTREVAAEELRPLLDIVNDKRTRSYGRGFVGLD